MGPSGSGKSTLMHCLAGLDSPTSGSVVIDGQEISRMSQRRLTALRRTRVGFVFQAYNLVPTLTAAENITLPLDIARTRVDRDWFDEVTTAVGPHRPPAPPPLRAVGRAAAARRVRAGARVTALDRVRRRADRQPRLTLRREVLAFLRRSVDELDQTVVMVTHDPRAASYAHRVVFLADGRLAGELHDPTQQDILDALALAADDAA